MCDEWRMTDDGMMCVCVCVAREPECQPSAAFEDTGMRVAQPRPQTLRPTRIPPEYVSPGLYKRIQFVAPLTRSTRARYSTSPGRKRHLYSSSLTSARYLLLPYKKGIAKKDTRRQARPPTNPCCPLQDTANYMDGATLTAVPASAGSRKLRHGPLPDGQRVRCRAVRRGVM